LGNGRPMVASKEVSTRETGEAGFEFEVGQ
jgi:hypothetical protein